MTDVDQNEIIAKIAVDSLERSISVLGKSLDDARRKVSVKFGAGFARYKQASAARYGSVRTLLHRDKPIPLKDLYVQTRIDCNGTEYIDDDIIASLGKPSRILVVGTAGGGKSMFMRFLNLVLTSSNNGVLPIFFELRTLNSNGDVSLFDAILGHASKIIEDLDRASFRSLIREGRAILLLDGFDEVDFDKREKFALEISELCRELPEISIVVSSRPDDLVGSLEVFTIYRVIPFAKEQAIDLLGRLPYDEVVREKFISEVNVSLYDKHKDFLSNPLLITMMLMTYHQFAEIPSKVHIFYQQAFETLFSWHDSSKDVFKRKSYTDLPIDEFQRVFSYFCANSYMAQSFTFSSGRVRQLLSAAITAERVEASPDHMLKDLLESTCLLQKEGLDIVFVHRSFQEYFTALFITRLEPGSRKKALDTAARRVHSDLVIPMAYEMAPAAIEKSWALPTLKSVLSKLERSADKGHLNVLTTAFDMVSISKDRVAMHWDVSKLWGSRILALDKLYGFSLPYTDKEVIGNSYDQLVLNLSNQKFRDEVNRNGFYPKEFGWDPMPSHIYLRLAGETGTLFSDVSMENWSNSLISWVSSTKSEVEARISKRDTSIDRMLGG